MKIIAIVGRFMFPKGDASSTRVLGIGKILSTLGYKVVFVGKCLETNKTDCLKGTYHQFQYFNIANGFTIKKRIEQNVFSGVNTIKILEENHIIPDAIIYYGTSSSYLLPLLKSCKKKNIPLITDIVEWYDPTHVQGGRFGPMALDTSYTIKKLIPKCNGVIAISSYLKDHYDQLGMHTIRIPQLIDKNNSKWKFESNGRLAQGDLNLVYAGNPGKKDLIKPIIISINQLLTEGLDIKLHLFGPTPEHIKKYMETHVHLIDELADNIVFHGRINQNEIPKKLSGGDFSVLIRPNKRYAHAGFPTKFVESLAAGVPVIANFTSDLKLYLKDDVNGIVVENDSVEAIKEALKKACSYSSAKMLDMRAEAKKEVLNSFDYPLFQDQLQSFMLEMFK